MAQIADSDDGFLAKITAFAVTDGLFGSAHFRRQHTLVDIDAINRRARLKPEDFKCLLPRRLGAFFQKRLPNLTCFLCGNHNVITGNA
jgi:hypothetical protein